MNMDNERLYRLETEVDNLKNDVNDQKVAVARLSEQVTSHEKRGEERHQQILGVLGDLKTDYRAAMKQQADDAQARQAFQSKLILGVLGIISTVAGGIWGMTPAQEAPHDEPPAQETKP
jgi:hypothetical protein